MEPPRNRRRSDPPPFTGRGLAQLFEDFDRPKAAPVEQAAIALPDEPADLVPYFTEQEVAAARREGYDAGMNDRRATTLRAHDEAVEQSLATIVAAMDQANAVAERIADAAAENIAKLLLRSLAGVLPALCARYGRGEVDAVLQSILPKLKTEPRVVVELHPDATDAVRSRLGGFAHDLVDHIDLVPSAAIAEGDVRIGWEDGQAVRDTAGLWSEVATVLVSLGLLDEQDKQLGPQPPAATSAARPAPPAENATSATATATRLIRENADVE